MEARRALPLRGPAIIGIVAAAILAGPSIAIASDIWDADVDGDSVGVGTKETIGAQEASSPSDSSEQSYHATNASTDPTVENRWVPDCLGASPTTTSGGLCPAVYSCPENDDLDAPAYFRMRQYQREVDRATGEPRTGWQHVGTRCITLEEQIALETEQDEEPSLLALVTQEWQRVQIPAAAIGINPPDGRTLVNFDTIFYTGAGEQQFPVTVLGRSVVIHAIPVEYTWHAGDGTTMSTETPGAAYPSKEITHRYEQTGAVTPRVDVQYRAEFTVDGGGHQPIPGLANVTGTSEDLTIREARTRLVGG